MILVIDGYNLLKQVLHSGIISGDERDHFVKQLQRYLNKKNHKAVLVFDGGSFERPAKEWIDAVCLVYAGLGVSADEHIREYIELNRGTDLLLVTSDREMQCHARHMTVESISSDDFYVIMLSALSRAKTKNKNSSTTELIKTTVDTDPMLDKLMQEMSGVVPHKRDDMIAHEAMCTHIKSKKKRKLIQQIKKL